MTVEQSRLEENKAIALRFNKDGWGTTPNWRAVWDECVAPDVVYHFNDQPELIVGLEANKAFNTALFEGFPDITCTLEDMVAEGSSVVYRTTLKGTQTGDFMGMPPTGKGVQIEDFTLVKIRDRKIVEWWYSCNLLSVMQQLGFAN